MGKQDGPSNLSDTSLRQEVISFKTQIFRGYTKYLNKFWRPNEIHMINHQTNKTTTLFFEDMAFNTGLSEKDFTQNSLKRSK